MKDVQEVIQGLMQELRRGTIIIGVLSQLSEPQYGYSLVSVLEEKGISIDPGTLYPLLRRLEKQELLESKWDTNEARPRKYYLLSPFGKEVYEQLCIEWKNMIASVESLIDHPGG
ncbi:MULTISPECIES: PadR family transcriptional regulator [Brevibacillus]|uniref:PadR family transcriptional regulator n=1 Tax=Brevibacillus invocatus TaxID=173959 RepID=A0A3M8C632_9BACL|nr:MULTISPECIES: PadR family transcriptional regulator [Brevibacillus]MCM3078672.1 PadR family transcriptional regulator [Brevibacillus invocatus]MCM3429079.1 PadR family transcriptional regulator [Brevibacillus invocatus]MDH4616240.1 PadR family transcriptional regulator [Brevibacillus sp. AY1]RNB71182.1 PadR family transcriptional regulator [Brevibacillus invocatus]